MVLTTSDWVQNFPLTERSQIISLLENAFINAGNSPSTTLTADEVESILVSAAGQVVTTPTIPPS